jgi:hypothetical protein
MNVTIYVYIYLFTPFLSHHLAIVLASVPGLAEHFVYFSEGMFLTALTSKFDFFTKNGQPIQYMRSQYDSYPNVLSLSQVAIEATRDVWNKMDDGKEIVWSESLPHFRSLLKTEMQKVEDAFADVIARTSHHKYGINFVFLNFILT